MSNNAYLLALPARSSRFDPDAGEESGRTLMYAPFHVPLMWLGLFSPHDMHEEVEHAFEALDVLRPWSWVSCTVPAQDAADRLRTRLPLLDALYRAQGGVSHHVGLFAAHVEGLGDSVIGLDVTELASTGGQPSVLGLRALLERLDRGDAGVRAQLDDWSTIDPSVRIITLAESSGCTAEEMHNYFRAMGSGAGGHATPWE